MKVKVCGFVLWVMLVSLTGCQNSSSIDLTEGDKAAIEGSLQNFLTAVVAGDWGGAVENYAADAILMPPNKPVVVGRSEIQQFFEGFPPIKAMIAQNIEVFGCGRLAIIRGSYAMTIGQEGGESVTDTGKFLEVRQKQADGAWLIYRDMFNSDLAK